MCVYIYIYTSNIVIFIYECKISNTYLLANHDFKGHWDQNGNSQFKINPKQPFGSQLQKNVVKMKIKASHLVLNIFVLIGSVTWIFICGKTKTTVFS